MEQSKRVPESERFPGPRCPATAGIREWPYVTRCAKKPGHSEPRHRNGSYAWLDHNEAKPQRGDAVERWLKRTRDGHPMQSEVWQALDDMLDKYREHSDTGTALFEETGS